MRKFARDIVDSRRNLAGLFMPFAIVLIFFMFTPISVNYPMIMNIVLLLFVVVMIVDAVVLGRLSTAGSANATRTAPTAASNSAGTRSAARCSCAKCVHRVRRCPPATRSERPDERNTNSSSAGAVGQVHMVRHCWPPTPGPLSGHRPDHIVGHRVVARGARTP